MRLARQAYEVPGAGAGEVWLRGSVVVHHEVRFTWVEPDRDDGASGRDRVEAAAVAGSREPAFRIEAGEVAPEWTGFVTGLCRRFHDHLRGVRVDYGDVEVDLEGLTPLQQALAEALRAVPWGEVVTYGELAALAGRPGAARAAGAFCAESRHALVVPCHRVVAASGIGGYGATGVGTKRRLLRLEGVTL